VRILITNDDGINASQLPLLAKWAEKLGEVTVVAPKYEQSGKSQGIEIHKPFECKKADLIDGVEAYAVNSTPADCVRFAVLGMKRSFDLVISGVNNGLNIGSDILYSGTVATIFEAARLGIKGIAFSTQPQSYDRATEYLDEIYEYMRDRKLFSFGETFNINIPAEVKGIRITRQGGPYYSDDFLPAGNDLYQPKGKPIFVESGNPELDTDSTLSGYITITPLTIDRTDMSTYKKIKECV